MPEYIERAAAAKIICAWCGTCPNPTVADLLKCDDICPEFAQIPVADVRPVVRGKWINNGWYFRCPECGHDVLFSIRNFCPNCGADMREGS
jgi:hypothetical protein